MEVIINEKVCQMEVDTAADHSVMSKSFYIDKFADKLLTPSKVKLKTYTGEVLDVLGEMQCDIVYKGEQYSLPIVVANYDARPTLLGRNWLCHIKIEWGEIFSISNENLVSAKSQLNDLLSKHAYGQLKVDKESQAYLAINTHKGLYSYLKLPYGVKSSPKMFQAKMGQILQGI